MCDTVPELLIPIRDFAFTRRKKWDNTTAYITEREECLQGRSGMRMISWFWLKETCQTVPDILHTSH